MKAIPLITFLLSCFPLISHAQQEKWDITQSHAPEKQVLDVTLSEGTWLSVDVSPDGQKIAFDLLGHIYEMPIQGGEARALTSGRSWNVFPRYSPDGKKIAFSSDRSGSWDIWVLDPSQDSLTNVSKMDLPVVQPNWTPDGRGVFGSALDMAAKSTAYRFNFFSDKQQIVSTSTFSPVSHFQQHDQLGVIFYEHLDQQLFQSGARIKTYDLKTGEIKVYLERPGGAFNPTLSPDGRYLAYGHRSADGTEMILHDLSSREEKTLVTGLDRDHQDYRPYYHGVQANFAWHPNGQEVFYSKGGKLMAVAIAGGQEREIPFTAKVHRELDKTIRFPVPVPDGNQTTLSHRWAHRTPEGILFESLGDLYLKNGEQTRQLTNTPEHETSPVFNPADRSIYFATWSDAELGSIYRQSLDGGARVKLSSRPAQYGGLALSPDGKKVAYFRSKGDLLNQKLLEEQELFELVLWENGQERKITDVSGSPNFSSRLPLTATFSPDGEHLYYTEFLEDKLTLTLIRLDGMDKQALYEFPHGVYAGVSPDGQWITYREYHRSFLTPLEFMGKKVVISAFDNKGYSARLDTLDGPYMSFPGDGLVGWARAGAYYEKSIQEVLDGKAAPQKTLLSFTYPVAVPEGLIALTNAKVITMNERKEILPRATILIEGNRIRAIGANVKIPIGAKVYDLKGHTIMPGMVDAHAHYGSMVSQFNVIEQRVPGLEAALAHGVTTMYELYGTAEKDAWIMDMLRAGKMAGPRLFTVASPVFGLREFRPKLYRPITSLTDAREVVRYNKEVGATSLKDYAQFKRLERHLLATAAREMGMNVVCETAGNSLMNWTQIVDGMSGLEHSMGLTPLYRDIVEFFKASDIGVTPTLLVVYNGPVGQTFFNQTERVWENEKLLNFATRERLLTYRRTSFIWPEDYYATEMAREMKKLFDQGVLINMGGHGQMLGLDAHWELELLVQGGFSPLEAIQCATINGARYHGLDKDLGSLEAGKLADLVILEKDPSTDIRNTRSIRYVMLNGVLYDGQHAGRVYPGPEEIGKMYFQR